MAYNPAHRFMAARVAVLVVVVLVSAWTSAAQVVTGLLIGTVRDGQGGALVAARVRLTSPVLIGGPMTAVTNDQGRFRFTLLPPGAYALEIDSPKFTAYRASDIRVGAGATVDWDAVLTPQSQKLSVDVVGSHLDPRETGLGVRFGSDLLGAIPNRRMFGFIVSAPGVSPSAQTTSFVSAFGSGVDQNVFLVDGTNITAASNGIARTEPHIDFIEQVHVQSVGASAEYGQAQGAVFDIVTRQGSNRFLGEASYYGQPAALTSQPVIMPTGVGSAESGYERQKYRDATTTLGGPIVRNRVWFFAGYSHLRDEDSQPGANPLVPKRLKQDRLFGKVTSQLASGWQLVQTVSAESWDNRELPTSSKSVEATQRLKASVPSVTFGHLTHASGNRMWDVSAGLFAFSQHISRAAGDPNVPGLFDSQTGRLTGAPTQLGEIQQRRWTIKATVGEYQPRLLGLDHDWKVGGQVDRGWHRSVFEIPTGIRYEDNPKKAISSDPSNASGLFVSAAAFITDSVTVRDRLTMSAGVRFDHSRAISPTIRRLRADGSDTGATIEGDGLLYTWNVISPRVGAAWQVTSDGRTIVRGSYGRFSQGVMTGELSLDHPGVAPRTTADFDPLTGSYTKNIRTTDPRVNTQIDPETRAPRTDAYAIGVDREIGRTLTASATYVRKNGSNFIGWTDVGGKYDEKSRDVPGWSAPVPVQVLSSGLGSRLFEVGNPEGYSLRYDGVTMGVDKRHAGRWQASGSYTFSRATGLQPSSGTTAAGAQVATVGAPPVSFAAPLTFGQDPNVLTNADGRLPNDRPHLLRVMAVVDVPRVGIMLAVHAQHSSGKPWARTADIALSQGPVRILLEPRGAQRLSSQTVLDVRVSKMFTIGQGVRIGLAADVLNVLNDTAEEGIASDRYDSPTLGLPTVFLDPRRVMLSVRFQFGR